MACYKAASYGFKIPTIRYCCAMAIYFNLYFIIPPYKNFLHEKIFNE